MKVNAVICSKLALTRCTNYARDISTLMFLCRDQHNKLNEHDIMQIHRLIRCLDQELQHTYSLLTVPDHS